MTKHKPVDNKIVVYHIGILEKLLIKRLNHKPCGILFDLGFLTYSFLLASKSLRKK